MLNFLKKELMKLKMGNGKELLWILEHPTTFTAGISSNKNEILDKKIKIIKQIEVEKLLFIILVKKLYILSIDLNNQKKRY